MASAILNFIYTVLKGGVYALALKGVSAGLKMIVETDLNYRMNAAGESHE
jgi:hypothetical protein